MPNSSRAHTNSLNPPSRKPLREPSFLFFFFGASFDRTPHLEIATNTSFARVHENLISYPSHNWVLGKGKGDAKLKKQKLVMMFLLAGLILSSMPLAMAAATLAPPTVSMPNSNWEETDSTSYPNTVAEHDPDGAGMLEYTDNTNHDMITIYYEKAQVSGYSSPQLKTEAENIFEEYDSSDTRSLDASGTATFAGVEAGYAEGYDDTEETYITELVFIKGGYYFNVQAYYDATTQSEEDVDALINSISVSGLPGDSTSSFTWLYAIIGVVAVIAVIVIVIMFARKKKSAQPQQQPPYDFPPPPPPPGQ